MRRPARSPEFERMRARLILRAVLPALAPLVENDVHARALARARRYAFRLCTPGGPAVTIVCECGELRVDPPDAGKVLTLSYLSSRQVNKVFDRSGLTMPVPSGHLSYLRYTGVFQELTARLEQVLDPDDNSDPGTDRLRCSLTLAYLLPAAVAELANHEPETRAMLDGYAQFTARVAIAGVAEGWIRRDASGYCVAGAGEADGGARPDVSLVFGDVATARQALDNTLDRLAAIGTGRLAIAGLLPLADDLGAVMERVDAYLR